MKEDAVSKDVKGREKKNLKKTDDVSQSKQQFQFMLETNPQIKGGLSWFSGVVKDWDSKSSQDMGHTRKHRMEHADAFALQRDANYLYSDRKRLMDIGHDSRYESAYQAVVKSKLEVGK